MRLRSAFIFALVALGTSLRGQDPPEPAPAPFVRGDLNEDGSVDLSDPLRVLFLLFLEGADPPCLSAGDVDDDGAIEILDAVSLLTYLFREGSAPAAPFPDCGVDATADSLGCEGHSPCAEEDVAPEITEWPVPWASTRPRDPFVDEVGRVWFVGQTGNYIAFLEPESGDFERFNLRPGAAPHNLIVGDGVWYAGNGDAHIGRMDRDSGEFTFFEMPDADAEDPHTLVFDQEGDIWFTVQRGNFVGKLSTGSGDVRLIPVPTQNALPYGIAIDSQDRPWFVEFGTNKIATIDRDDFSITEFPLPRAGTRPRRIGITSDDAIWYVDYAQGYLGRFIPATGNLKEWPAPSGSGSDPYAMTVDHRDRIWFVETGPSPNRFVGFNPETEEFFGITPVPSGGGTVRHMYFHAPAREIWFGTDVNTVGRARVR
jgi:virginiamycin B lyase